jgi:hypothetical protein
MIAAGCLIALALGLALAYPLLIVNKPVTTKADLAVNVVYAYFGASNFNPNITGLYINYTNLQQHYATENTNGMISGNAVYDTDIVSYFIVLNVTNLSSKETYINSIETLVGPSVSASTNGTGFVVGATNPLLSDTKVVSGYAGWNNIWEPNISRLIYLSGIIGSLNTSYSLIQNHIWAYVQINGHIYDSANTPVNGVYYEQLPLQTFGQEHLYNNLVGENQTLIFLNEFDVSVGRLLQ